MTHIRKQIRQAYYVQLAKLTSYETDEGRLQQYEKSDFDHPTDHTRCRQRVIFNTFQTTGELYQRTMGDCCIYEMETFVDIGIFMPVEYADEDELDEIEQVLWPYLGKVILPEGIAAEPSQIGTQPSPPEASFPLATRLIRFRVEYGFNTQEPSKAIRL